MYIQKTRTLRLLLCTLFYLGLILTSLSLVTFRMHAQGEGEPAENSQAEAQAEATPPPKPYFSLSTNRTYSPNDRARVWINYQSIDHLDFRVYRVNDPVKFFKKLSDPHKMGEQEKGELAASFNKSPSFLERIRGFKIRLYGAVRNYFRKQLQRESRETFNQKFRKEEDRVPLNVADYARVPLLNPDQLVTSWRERLPAVESEYDARIVPLGKREPGVYLVEAVNGDLRAYTIAIVSDLVLVNKTTADGSLMVYAANRNSGQPKSDVNVEVAKTNKTLSTGKTDRNGILQLSVEKDKATPTPQVQDEDMEGEGSAEAYLIMASDEDDNFAISNLDSFLWGGYEGSIGELTGYVYTDRPVYRPGQKVYFKGILRHLGKDGYEMLKEKNVDVTIEDSNGGKIFEKSLDLSSKGTFNGEMDLSDGAPLNSYRIVARVGSGETSGSFEVKEYKKPEYKMQVSAQKKFASVGEKVKFSIEARYFFGAPVTNADVKYYIYRSRYYHWWLNDTEVEELGLSSDSNDDSGYYGYGNDVVQDGEGRLDANGRMEVTFQVPQPDEKDPYDYRYRLEAQVTDASRRQIDGVASFVGTRGSVVASVEAEKYVYYEGDTAKLNISTTDYEGRPVATKVTLKFVERKWIKGNLIEDDGKYKRYEYKEQENELASGEVTTNAQGQATYNYTIPIKGSINIKAIVQEGKKDIVSTGGYLYVADKSDKWADWYYEDYGSIKIVTDKKSYQPGETAHVLAMLPTDGANLLVTTELANVMTARIINAKARAVMIDVPIEARYAPNVYLSLTYVKDGEMYTTDHILAVPARNKLLNIEIIPNKKEYKPRDTASYTILARNSDGSPASNVELSLGVVDEAIYSIQPEIAGDIRKGFYGRRYNRVQTSYSVSYYFNGYSDDKALDLAKKRASYQLADFKNDGQYAEATVRKEFKDTAFWAPSIVTGGDGKATVEVKLPDNLTTWRATARAISDDTRVGSSLGKVLSRKDLILRLESPRFLTEGDTVTLSGIVHNYLNEDKVTRVSIQVTGANLLDQAVHTVTIPKQGEHRIDWRVSAPNVGQIQMLAKAETNAESDAIEFPLEVVPHGLKQTKGGSLTVSGDEEDKTVSYDLPSNAHPNARTLYIDVAPSIAGTLFGALDYLTGFPYGCTEQTMSRFLPNIVVAQTLKEVKTTSIRATNNLDEKVKRGFDRLYAFQHGDGGWGWWKDDKSDPFMTAYVIDGLTMASQAGYPVESQRISRGRDKLKKMLDAKKDDSGNVINSEIRAYMVYALVISGEVDEKYINDLFNKRGSLQPYGKAMLALTLKRRGSEDRAKQVAREIEGSARANEYDAHWESKQSPSNFITDVETTALSLKALAQINSQSPLLPKIARWLVSNKYMGYGWYSTKDTAFALIGLTEYIKVSNELSPNYTVEVYLNGEQVLNRQITASDAASPQPLTIERKGGTVSNANQIRIVKRGSGMLYLSTALTYFTRDEQVPAQASSNLKITREYLRLEVVEDESGASWSTQPLKGDVRSGDIIVSKLRVQGARGQYLMIEDPIPAGCEQIQRTSGINLDYNERDWTDWYSSREFRDEKTAIFLDYFDGDATFKYALKVQIPGQFRVAPARAELMYQPTVQSNTSDSKLQILDK